MSDHLSYQQITIYKSNVGFIKKKKTENRKTDSTSGTGRASPVFHGKHPFRKSYQFSPGGCEISTDWFTAREEDNNSYIQVNLIRLMRPY